MIHTISVFSVVFGKKEEQIRVLLSFLLFLEETQTDADKIVFVNYYRSFYMNTSAIIIFMTGDNWDTKGRQRSNGIVTSFCARVADSTWQLKCLVQYETTIDKSIALMKKINKFFESSANTQEKTC